MLRRRGIFIIMIMTTVMMLVLSSSPASGHAPEFPKGNTSIDSAWEVHDPSKSWAIYTTLPEGKAHYYQMDFQIGDRILLNLIIPINENDRGFIPVMALIGPGLAGNFTLPSLIEVPQGLGHIYVESDNTGEPEFEPFSPGTFIELSSLDMEAPESGTYYVAVWEHPSSPGVGGNYAFPVGFVESFTIEEMVLIPFSLLEVYSWEGQDVLMVLLPMFILLIAGAILFILKMKELIPRMMPINYAAYISGLLIAGSGLITMVQLGMSVIEADAGTMVLVSVFFIIAQIGIGGFLVKIGYSGRKMNKAARAGMLILGVIAIFIWAGYLVGPCVAIIGSLLPSQKRISE